MFAILALVAFIIVLFHGHLGTIDLTVLGLAFLAAHFAWPVILTALRRE